MTVLPVVLLHTFSENSKQPLNLGDEPDLYRKARDRNSLYLNKDRRLSAATADASSATTTFVAHPTSVPGKAKRTSSPGACENGYVPTVGRWGVEWPS